MIQSSARLCLAIAVCCALAACSASPHSSPQSIAKTFLTTVGNGQADKAISYMHFKASQSKKQIKLAKKMIHIAFTKLHQKLEKKGGIESIEFTETDTSDDDHATVHYVIHFGNDSQRQSHIGTVRVDGKWYIQGP